LGTACAFSSILFSLRLAPGKWRYLTSPQAG